MGPHCRKFIAAVEPLKLEVIMYWLEIIKVLKITLIISWYR